MSLQTFLNRSLPQFRTPREIAHLVIGLSLFIFLFVFIYRPFGQFAPEGIPWSMISMGFALVAFFVVGINHVILFGILPLNTPKSYWNVKREFLFSLHNILTVSIFNYIFAASSLGAPWTGEGFMHVAGFTASIGIFPSLGIWYYKYQFLGAPKKKPIPRQQNNSSASLPIISLLSGNGKVALTISPQDISHLIAVGNYVKVFFWKDGKPAKQLIRNRMSELEKQLTNQSNLLRCHRSYIINLNHIKSIRGNASGYKISLTKVEGEIPVSRSFTQEIREVIASEQFGIDLPGHGHWSRG